MHDEFLSDPEITEFDHYYMTDPAYAKQARSDNATRDPSFPKRQLPWGVIPGRVDRSKILMLCIHQDDESVTKLPEVVRELPNLRWLDLPRRFVATLEADAIPPTVRTLRISYGGTATLPKRLVLPGLERLLSDRDGMLKFKSEQIPNVVELTLKLDPGGSLLREVVGMSRLRALVVSPVSNRSVLEAVVKLPLRYLKLNRGHLDTIEPIRDCPTLTNIWLEDLMKLTSIAPLTELPNLRELMVTYCSRLQLGRTLLELPALRKLYLFACKEIGMTAIRPEVERLGLDFFLCSGTF